MSKRKWYVVTIGTDVGVFPTWLDAGPLVKGVPEALYQSFNSLEEANMVFAREQARGRTRIVGGEGGRTTPREPRNNSPAYSNRKDDSFESSIFINPEYRATHDNGPFTAHSSHSLEVEDSVDPSRPRLHKPISVSRSASTPSSSLRRFQIIDSFFANDSTAVGVKAGLSSGRNTPALTPTSDPTSSLHSPSRTKSSSTPRAIVKTPSWVQSYPKAPVQPSQPLSPLHNPGLSLKYFQEQQHVTAASIAKVDKASSEFPTTPESSFYFSPAKYPGGADGAQKTVVDPRSPITNQSQVPELMFTSSLLFSRPSPSVKASHLSLEASGCSHLKESHSSWSDPSNVQ